MNIVVLTGSPHRNGTTSVLTEEFIKGAESKGHNVFRTPPFMTFIPVRAVTPAA